MSLLDGPFRSLASDLIGTLGASAVTITRKENLYDAATDTDSPVTTTADLKMTPPAPFEERRVNGSSVLATDLMALVAAKDVDALSFGLSMDSNVTLSLVYDGATYQVVGVREIRSGDQAAAIELQLRR